MHHQDRKDAAEHYAGVVTARINDALARDGLDPHGVGGDALADALLHGRAPLTIALIGAVASRLDVDPTCWMVR